MEFNWRRHQAVQFRNIQRKIEKGIYKYLFLSIVVIAICYDLFAVPCTIMTNLRLYMHARVFVYVCLCVFVMKCVSRFRN